MKSTKTTSREPKLNVELLRRVQTHISEEPRRLNMLDWSAAEGGRPDDMMPPCNTVGCISGWACHLSGKRPHTPEGFARMGAELLGLPKPDKSYIRFLENESFTGRLFLTHFWPEPYASEYAATEDQYDDADFVERARITAARIEHFITTGE